MRLSRRPARMPRATRLVVATAAAGAMALGGLAAAPAPAHADVTPCMRDAPGDDAVPSDVDPGKDAEDPTLAALRLADVHQIATGRNVGIAVIDSGIRPSGSLRVAGGKRIAGTSVQDGHGTIVAGLVAGRGDATGIAPDAVIYDLQVDAGEPEEGSSAPRALRPEHVVAAIDWAIANRSKVQVISLALGFEERVPALETAVRKAEGAGIMVVAAAGNRTPEEPGAEPTPTADASVGPEPAPDEVLHPARMDTVIGVTSRGVDLSMTSGPVLVGPGIDVSAPVVGLRSVMLGGLVCTVTTPASSWATAVVSGVVALLLEKEPSLTPAQVRAVIRLTSQGGYFDSALDGHGMVQPYAALTRVVDMDADGNLEVANRSGDPDYIAAEPEPPVDRYADRRDSLLWWGLGAGGLLLLALVLRPLLTRRR